jgi:predicted Zn-ribbon and HTH transcriptional regulator
MKNSLMANPKPKVNLKDIVEGKEMREQAIFTANGVKYWADRISKDQLATHADCQDCGVEFEKDYTYSKRCFNCQSKHDAEVYLKMEVVEWDGKSGLCLHDTDTYFFDIDDVLEYAEENEVEPHELKLVLCTPTSFSQINISEHVQESVHEDWEPDAELERLEKALNDYLATASTNTWTAGNKRVIITKP